jgi:alpha-beta hydrolase superfamily lysophospholipase
MVFLRAGRFLPLLVCGGALPLALGGCPGETPPPDEGIRPIFELGAAPLDFGAVPFPDDLYLVDGHVELGAIPREGASDPVTVESVRAALREIDGFGAMTGVYFPLEGAIDAATLPETAGASLVEDASVFLVDADPASPTAFRRVPVVARWDEAERTISLQPADGHPLWGGRRYAAVLTRRVLDRDGAPIAPAEAFASLRDATERPADPQLARAYDEYAPVLASLAATVAREDVAALAVFTVQTVARDLEDARAIVRGGAAPAVTIRRVVAAGPDLDALLGMPAMDLPGSDVPGGVRHSHVGWVIDGTFPTHELSSPGPGRHGRWMRAADGSLVVKRSDDAWFTLVLPAAADPTMLEVVVYQHGLGSSRAAVFALADTLCESGFAVAAIDIPYHGMRTTGGAEDREHRYGSTPGPDLYGDVEGQSVQFDYLGIIDETGELSSFHPFYVRDVLRQSVVDLMTLVRALDEADWSGAIAMGAPAFAFVPGAEVGFVGNSLGGVLGATFVANEPRVGAALLSVTGGHLSRMVELSPAFSASFLGILLPRFGLDYDAIDWDAAPPSSLPGVVLFQTLLDRGDSIAHAPRLGQRPIDVLLHMAEDDETVPNLSTEALARAIGMPMVGSTPSYVDLETAASPLSGNATIGPDVLTRAIVVYGPATHGLIDDREGTARWMHPPEPPFVAAAPTPVANPIDAAQRQMQHFFETWRAGTPEVVVE